MANNVRCPLFHFFLSARFKKKVLLTLFQNNLSRWSRLWFSSFLLTFAFWQFWSPAKSKSCPRCAASSRSSSQNVPPRRPTTSATSASCPFSKKIAACSSLNPAKKSTVKKSWDVSTVFWINFNAKISSQSVFKYSSNLKSQKCNWSRIQKRNKNSKDEI